MRIYLHDEKSGERRGCGEETGSSLNVHPITETWNLLDRYANVA